MINKAIYTTSTTARSEPDLQSFDIYTQERELAIASMQKVDKRILRIIIAQPDSKGPRTLN